LPYLFTRVNMDLKILFCVVFLFVLAKGSPTMYKVNENKIFEKGVFM